MMDTKAAARRILAETAGDDPLTVVDRMVLGDAAAVQLRIPISDPAAVRRHLALIETQVRELREMLEKSRGNRLDLMTVKGAIKSLNRKLNAYRKPSEKW